MDRHCKIRSSKRTIYDLDRLALSQRSPSPLPAPLDLSCHNRRSSPQNTNYDQETAYDYSATGGVIESSYSLGIQESEVSTSQQLHYSQYPYNGAHHGLYPYDQEFALRISSTCSPPTTDSDLYSHPDYHQYRVISSSSPNPYEANSNMYSASHYHSPQVPYSPTHDSSLSNSEALSSAYSVSGMNYQPLTVSTSHVSHTGHARFVSPQDHYETVPPHGLVSPTGSQFSSYGTCIDQLSYSQLAEHDIVDAASACDSQHSSYESGISPDPPSTTVPECLARYPKGKARRQKIVHKNLTEEEIIQRKREINNDSSRRHRQRKNLSMKQLEEEEQRELARQVHLTKTRDILKQQTELLGSLIKSVDLNRR